MPATRKRPARAPALPKCPACAGAGWVKETHTVGRGKKARPAGEVEVLCPTCLGSGTTAQ